MVPPFGRSRAYQPKDLYMLPLYNGNAAAFVEKKRIISTVVPFSASMNLALTALLLIQDPSKELQREDVIAKVDRAKVEAAIKKGVEHLYWRVDNNALKPFDYQGEKQRYDDLVLLALVHAGANPNDPQFQKVLKNCLDGGLERTYSVSCQAMALVKLDKARYQWRIAQCAQFLVDNQCPNGTWNYGDPVAVDHIKPPARPPKPGTKALDRIIIRKRGEGPKFGDNSNSQYAAMGLRAAHEAEIGLPHETVKAAADWWDKSQNDDGGWGYGAAGKDSYGSMTAGGMASLSSLVHMLGSAPRFDPRLARARKWIAERFTVSDNPKFTMNPKDNHLYYWLYALERAGTLYGTELFGEHLWYPEGAKLILDQQKTNGSWNNYAVDTCFAILFLRRATDDFRPPVATGDKQK